MDVNLDAILEDVFELCEHRKLAGFTDEFLPLNEYENGAYYMSIWTVSITGETFGFVKDLPLSFYSFTAYERDVMYTRGYGLDDIASVCIKVNKGLFGEEVELKADYVASKPTDGKWVFKAGRHGRDYTLKHIYPHYGLCVPSIKVRQIDLGYISSTMMSLGNLLPKDGYKTYEDVRGGTLDVRFSVIRKANPLTASVFSLTSRYDSIRRNTAIIRGAKLRDTIIMLLNDFKAALPFGSADQSLYVIDFGYTYKEDVARSITFTLDKHGNTMITNDTVSDPNEFYRKWMGSNSEETVGSNGVFTVDGQQFVGEFKEDEDGYTITNVSRVGNPTTETDLSPVKRSGLISDAEVAESIRKQEIDELDKALASIGHTVTRGNTKEEYELSPEVRALLLDNLKLHKGPLFVGK